jgi:hypothetical protein
MVDFENNDTRKLASEGYKRLAAKKCVIILEVNHKKRVAWCRERRNWTVDLHWRKYYRAITGHKLFSRTAIQMYISGN